MLRIDDLRPCALQFIPMPVLYGVFLYMGVASLNGVQVSERVSFHRFGGSDGSSEQTAGTGSASRRRAVGGGGGVGLG